MIDTLTLTPSQVGLGDLTEFALLTLVANTHYRVLTQGTDATPRQILDKAGEALYPSVFALHLRVPAERPIESFALWEQLGVGAEVRCFGRNFLDVRGVLGKAGEVPESSDAWDGAGLPSVRWAGAWTLKGEVAMPAPSFLANIPKAAAPPELLSTFRTLQSRGKLGDGPAPSSAPVFYPVVAGRDVARGRQMMFSQFVVVMDYAERVFLTERVRPAFTGELVDCRTTLERRIFYFGNCRADDVVEVTLDARLERTVPGRSEGVAIALTMELTEARTKRLLALAETKKLLAIPAAEVGLLREVERMLARHGEGTPLREASHSATI